MPIKPKKKTKKAIRTTKKAAALKVFADEIVKAGGVPERKTVVSRFQKECKLTPAGASTYYHNIRNMLR